MTKFCGKYLDLQITVRSMMIRVDYYRTNLHCEEPIEKPLIISVDDIH